MMRWVLDDTRDWRDTTHLENIERIQDLPPPTVFPAMQTAIDRVHSAVSAGEQITLVGDYDCDGGSGCALLELALRKLGAKATTFLPGRLKDGFGLSAGIIDQCAGSLLITVDNGSAAVAGAAYALAQGRDLIITDHHLPTDPLPHSLAWVHPLTLPPGSTFRYLSGAGVAWVFASALLGAWQCSTLDLCAIGTVGDVVPLRAANRLLVREGLQRLTHRTRPGLAALLATVRGEIKASHLAFQACPRINVAGRLVHADLAFKTMLAPDTQEAEALTATLNELNLERRALVASALAEIGTPDGHVHVGNWHPGIVGVIAGRLVELTGQPQVVIGMQGVLGHGSCRTVEEFHLGDAIAACRDHLVSGGGHAKAAGLKIREESIQGFKACFDALVSQRYFETPVLRIAEHLTLADVNPELMRLLSTLEPTGEANPAPVFVAGPVKVSRVRRLKDVHLAFTATQGARTLGCVWFNAELQLEDDTEIEIAFSPAWNEWQGRKTIQLMVQACH